MAFIYGGFVDWAKMLTYKLHRINEKSIFLFISIVFNRQIIINEL